MACLAVVGVVASKMAPVTLPPGARGKLPRPYLGSTLFALLRQQPDQRKYVAVATVVEAE
jgi:hypothetical protein